MLRRLREILPTRAPLSARALFARSGRSGANVPLALTALTLLAFVVGCEPEVGSPCGDPSVVDSRVVQEPGQNDLVRDLGFEGCRSQGLCASVDGSRPFCTKSCETDLDCGADGFTCDRLVSFGQLACEDWTEENDCVQPDGTASDQPKLYCQAPRQTIEKRDCDWGRGSDAELCQSLQDQPEGEAQ